jgi:hypothetical protein
MKITSAFLGLGLVGVVIVALLGHSGASPASDQGGCTDLDGDGYGLGCAAGPDCNDRDPAIHPGAVETCNSPLAPLIMSPACPLPGEVGAGPSPLPRGEGARKA